MARIAATAHSAVGMSCTPRASHRSHPGREQFQQGHARPWSLYNLYAFQMRPLASQYFGRHGGDPEIDFNVCLRLLGNPHQPHLPW